MQRNEKIYVEYLPDNHSDTCGFFNVDASTPAFEKISNDESFGKVTFDHAASAEEAQRIREQEKALVSAITELANHPSSLFSAANGFPRDITNMVNQFVTGRQNP